METNLGILLEIGKGNKMLFSQVLLDKLSRNSPSFSRRALSNMLDDLQKGKIVALMPTKAGINQLIAFTYNVTTGATSGLEMFKGNAPFKFEVVDVVVQPRENSTNGTLKVTNGTNDITDAMVCAVDKTMVHSASIDDAYSEIDAGETLEIVCAGDTVGNTKALVTVLAIAKD